MRGRPHLFAATAGAIPMVSYSTGDRQRDSAGGVRAPRRDVPAPGDGQALAVSRPRLSPSCRSPPPFAPALGLPLWISRVPLLRRARARRDRGECLLAVRRLRKRSPRLCESRYRCAPQTSEPAGQRDRGGILMPLPPATCPPLRVASATPGPRGARWGAISSARPRRAVVDFGAMIPPRRDSRHPPRGRDGHRRDARRGSRTSRSAARGSFAVSPVTSPARRCGTRRCRRRAPR